MRGGGFSLIIIILIVLVGIYYWSPGTSSQLNTSAEVLDAMGLDTEIDFSDSVDADFGWNFKGNEEDVIENKIVSGTQITVAGLENNKIDLIYTYLEAQNFEVDVINTADNVTGSSKGYAKDDLVCVVDVEIIDFEADPITYDVTVSCGVYIPEVVVEDIGTDEEQIVALFADKYDKPVDEVEIVMENQVKVFAKGSIKFAGEPGGGLWLAFNGDNGWGLVFDGDGSIPCADIEGYDFPTDMVSECVDSDGALVTLV